MAAGTRYKTLTTESLKQLRVAVNNTCSVCGDNSKKVLVHHKDTNHFNQTPDNLQLVCRPCHSKLHQLINRKYESPLHVRTQVILLRLTPEEKTILIEQSKLAGISMSALVRLMLSQYAKKDLSFS